MVAGAVLVTTIAVAAASPAAAHEGGQWFALERVIQDSVLDKWRLSAAACFGDPRGHSQGYQAKKSYDHFRCIVRSEVRDRVCLARIHIVGRKWHQMVLTFVDWRKEGLPEPGPPLDIPCTSADLRTRPGYLNPPPSVQGAAA